MIILSTNAPAITEALKRLAARVGPADLRPAMKEIGEELRNSTRARFQVGAAPDGTPWLPLAADTLLNRLRRGRHGNKPLIDTGQLSKTIRYQIIDGGAGVVIGTNRNFGRANAAVHQFGTRRAGRGRNVTIPARPFLGFSAADAATVLDILRESLRDAV